MLKQLFRSKNLQPKLGRWTREPESINRKIDLANTDNCGTCDIKTEIIRRDYMTLEDDIIQMDILVNYSGFHSKK